jgi:hypothetical protein
MRPFVICMILCGLAVGITAQGKPAATPDEREVSKLIQEYLSNKTNSDRRIEIEARLRLAPPIVAQKPLKQAIVSEGSRTAAIGLALELHVPGLFDTAKKYLDSADESNIVRLGFDTHDKGAVDFLFDRWKKADVGSASLAFVQDGFTSYPVELAAIARFKPLLDDKDRAEMALAVVIFQFGLDADLTVAGAKDEWPAAEEAYRRDAQAFAVSGTDLLRVAKVEGGRAKRIGRNVRLTPGGDILCDVKAYGTEAFSVTARVRVEKDSECGVGISSTQGTWEAQLKGGEWIVRCGDETEKASAAKTGWNTVRFSVSLSSDEKRRNARHCILTVNDTVLVERGTLNGELIDVHFKNTGKVVVAVAGVDLTK